jgi:hypothetical protein
LSNTITKTTRVVGQWDTGFLPTLLDIEGFLKILTDAGVDPGTRITEVTPQQIVVEWVVQ